METFNIDYVALFLIVLKGLLGVLVLYVVLLLSVRFSGKLTLDVCPRCGAKLKRMRRRRRERTVRKYSFGILPLKRFRCYLCYWEGSGLKLRKSSTRSSSHHTT